MIDIEIDIWTRHLTHTTFDFWGILIWTHLKTSQELRMLPRSLSDCQSLTLNVMIQIFQIVRMGQLGH